LSAPIVLGLARALARNLLRVQNAAEQAKYVVFAKACLAKWSRQARVAVVVAWAQLSLLRVQSVQAKVAHRLVSHTPLMFREELTQVRQ
jgi:hypothetical protein